MSAPPAAAAAAVLVKSADLSGEPTVSGYDFNNGVDHDALLASMISTGFQATNLGRAMEEIDRMRKWRLSDEPVTEDTKEEWRDEAVRAKTKAKIFLGYTSNLISSGVRESLRYLVEHRHVDVLVTSAGGVEEDLIKALARTYLGEFQLRGAELRAKGLNRIGNLLVPNENYCKFEDWIVPILNAMHDEQERHGVVWTPSKMIHRFGKEIDDESSVCYWCYKNNVPMFCPALTDGSIGDMLYFHSYRRPGLVCDIVGDIRLMNDHAIHAAPRRTGMIVLGGGVAKHHINNANLMRNGADFSVCVSTAQEFDGSDSGARPDEAVSWGKIRAEATPVKVYADATIVFPLMVARTFARREEEEG
mmetsp:Transcript_4237/g.17027  ORF Transcript_4237/g.17027 Transcript_4237/m.17027 type:complete len:361 (-) Transcript_4237:57-1139(-)|eukprot:PRCOL_00001978-RA